MTTGNNREVSPSPRRYGASRAIHNVAQLSGKSEDPKQKGFFDRPRKGSKSYWDWMQLLIIPFVLTVGGLLLSTYQHNTDQQRATDQQQATVLQTYIDNIQDLLLNHTLLKSKPTDDVAILARARTLTALQGLDPKRKGLLVKFIFETGLIGFMSVNNYVGPPSPPSDVSASLCVSNCKEPTEPTEHDSIIILAGADLSGADLSGADLSGADLYKTNLTNADLSDAFLEDADLSDTDLSGADLSDAFLQNANLNNGSYLSQKQLDQVRSCKDAFLPLGLTCHVEYGIGNRLRRNFAETNV